MSRRCRTCPAIFSAPMGDQCSACLDRTGAVATAIKPPAPTKKIGRPPKPRTCETDGHHACEHYAVILCYFEEFMSECGLCGICGAEDDKEPGDLKHKPGCAYVPLIGQGLTTTSTGDGTGGR